MKGACGHEIETLLKSNQNYLKNMIAIKDYSEQGEAIIKNIIVCNDCLVWYIRNNLICYKQQDAENWVKNAKN